MRRDKSSRRPARAQGLLLMVVLLCRSLLATDATGSAAGAVSPVDLSAALMVVSHSGHRVARITETKDGQGPGIDLITDSKPVGSRFLPLSRLEKESGVPTGSITALTFSDDGAYLAVQLSDEDVRSVVLLADLRGAEIRFRPLLFGSEKTSASPHWVPAAHELAVRPVSIDLGDARDRGVMIVNADTGSTRTILGDFFVIGKDFCMATDTVIAVVSRPDSGGVSRQSIVSERLASGKVQVLRFDR